MPDHPVPKSERAQAGFSALPSVGTWAEGRPFTAPLLNRVEQLLPTDELQGSRGNFRHLPSVGTWLVYTQSWLVAVQSMQAQLSNEAVPEANVAEAAAERPLAAPQPEQNE